MKKLIIFDWKSIIEDRYSEEWNEINAWKNVLREIAAPPSLDNIEKIRTHCDSHAVNTIRSYKDYNQWIEGLFKDLGLEFGEESISKFIIAYINEFDKMPYNKALVRYMHNLKESAEVAIIADLCIGDIMRLHKQTKVLWLDYSWLSCDMGYVQPDMRIFENIENETEQFPSNILFIHNSDECISVAKQKGWNTIKARYGDNECIIEEIERFIAQPGKMKITKCLAINLETGLSPEKNKVILSH